MKVCNSTWSLHREIPERMSLLQFPAWNASIGISAIEIVESHLPSLERGFLDELREVAGYLGCAALRVNTGRATSARERKERWR